MLTADNNALSPLEGGLVFAGFAAAIVIVGEVVFGRRDLG